MKKTLYLLPYEDLGKRIRPSMDEDSFWELSNHGIASSMTTANQIKSEQSGYGVVMTSNRPWHRQSAAIIHDVLKLPERNLVSSHFLNTLNKDNFLDDVKNLKAGFEKCCDKIPEHCDYGVMIVNKHFINALEMFGDINGKTQPIMGYRQNGLSVTYKGDFEENVTRPKSQIQYRQQIDDMVAKIGFIKTKQSLPTANQASKLKLYTIESWDIAKSKRPATPKKTVKETKAVRKPIQRPPGYYDGPIG